MIGPEIVSYSAVSNPEQPFGLAFTSVIALYVFALLVLMLLRNTQEQSSNVADAPPRPLFKLFKQPIFFVAVLGGVVGQGVMTYIMTATPISMNIADGYSFKKPLK